MLFINPRCACAARVTVIGLCIFVRLSIFLLVLQQRLTKQLIAILTGLRLYGLYF